MTLRQLLISYYAYQVNSWDQASQIIAGVNNLNTTVISIFSKEKPQYKAPVDFHPYRTATSERNNKIRAEDIGLFKIIGDRLIRER